MEGIQTCRGHPNIGGHPNIQWMHPNMGASKHMWGV